jgi:hypothetical protein
MQSAASPSGFNPPLLIEGCDVGLLYRDRNSCSARSTLVSFKQARDTAALTKTKSPASRTPAC